MPKPQKAQYAAITIACGASVFMSLISLKVYEHIQELETRLETVEYILAVILGG